MKKIYCLIITLINFKAMGIVDPDLLHHIEFVKNQIKIEYSHLDSSFIEIDPENQPYAENFSDKDDTLEEITYYLHGFMGSPHEMTYLSMKPLKMGQTIFNDLIIGYGTHASITNKVKKELYCLQVEQNLNFIFKKYKKVNLVGFSTGGLLISDYLQKHPKIQSQVNKIQLISPFFYSYISFAPSFGKFLQLFFSEIDVYKFYKYTNHPDVEIITLEPKFYTQKIPLFAATEIAELAKNFVTTALPLPSLKNIEIYLTKNDQILSWSKTENLLKKIYPQSKITIFENTKSPHHLMVPTVSNQAFTIQNNF